MSRFSSAIHSAGRSPVAAANRIIGSYRGPIAAASASSSSHVSNGCCIAAPSRVVDADLGRVDVDHSPGHSAVEHLPQRLSRLESVAGRERHPPLGDRLRGQLSYAAIAEDGDCLGEQVAELSIVTGCTSCCARYVSTSSASVSLRTIRRSRRSRSNSRSSASRACCSEANPPRWTRLEPRPPIRRRYAHSRSPLCPRRRSSIVPPDSQWPLRRT